MNIDYQSLIRPIAYIMILFGVVLVVRGYYEHQLEAYTSFVESKKKDVTVEPNDEDQSSPSPEPYDRPHQQEEPQDDSLPETD